MNYKMIFNIIGRILLTEAALFALPLGVALLYGERNTPLAFLIAAAAALLLGGIMVLLTRKGERQAFAREGFIAVALAWIFLSLIGALPFYISGEIKSFTDAVFETVSGFTTTGASILTDIEAMSHSLLFWRSFTHWIGGMGVLVLMMAIIPNSSKGSMHMLRAEMPGPIIGKLVPRARDTAMILYLIYLALTITEILFLLAGGMPLFDSVIHALGTAGTGGFGIKADSLGGYSPYHQWVIAIFMLLFGANFNLYYLILIRKVGAALKSQELWFYGGFVLASTTAVTLNVLSVYENFGEALRHSAFQVASIITTTGYSSTDFNLWPDLSKGILLLLMLIGGCAGSTAGGLKVSRVVLLFKIVKREIKRALHPRSVSKVRFEGHRVEETVLDSVSGYFAIYAFCLVLIFLLLSFEPFGLETNLSATIACFNNVGPGFGGVGPLSSYTAYSPISKWGLSFAMLLGRLEILPLIIALSPASWNKKYR